MFAERYISLPERGRKFERGRSPLSLTHSPIKKTGLTRRWSLLRRGR